jgi:deoxyadenosine/deoxycytidine kinase
LLDSFYKQWIPTYNESPLLTINSENYDFVNQQEHLEEIIKAVDYCIKTRKNLVLNAPGNFSSDFAK